MGKYSSFTIGLITIFFFTTLVSAVIFFNLILPADSFHWDESHHAVYGMWLAQAVQEGNWENFWYWTHRQALWPFFHSWILSLFFLIFGISFSTARFLSLAIFFTTVVLVYLTANKLSEKPGWKIGGLASFLVLTSPLMLSFSAQNMLEGLGALELLLVVFLYFLAEERKKWWNYLLVGFVLGMTIVTKYNYAFLILISLALAITFELFGFYKNHRQLNTEREMEKKKKEKIKKVNLFTTPFYPWIYKVVLISIPILLIALAWFLSEDPVRKFQMLLWSKTEVAEKQGLIAGFWQNLLFYPQALIKDYCFSPWLGSLVVLSIFLPLAIKNFPKTKTLYFITWGILFLSTFIIKNKMNRLLYPGVPIIFILFAATLFCFLDLITLKVKNQKLWNTIFLFALLLPSSFSFLRIPKMLSGDISDIDHGIYVVRKPERLTDVLEFFAQNIPKDRSVSTAISMANMNPYVFYFYFRDWQAPFFTLFQASDPRFLQSDYFVTVELAEPEKFGVLEDSVNKWNAYLKENEKTGKIQLWKTKRFNTLGVTAKIYWSKKVNMLRRGRS